MSFYQVGHQNLCLIRGTLLSSLIFMSFNKTATQTLAQ